MVYFKILFANCSDSDIFLFLYDFNTLAHFSFAQCNIFEFINLYNPVSLQYGFSFVSHLIHKPILTVKGYINLLSIVLDIATIIKQDKHGYFVDDGNTDYSVDIYSNCWDSNAILTAKR